MRAHKGSRARKSDFIIPRFAIHSLSAAATRWLHEEAWEEAHQRDFAELVLSPPWGLSRALPYESGRRRAAPEVAGRWLLYFDGIEPAVAAVEAHGFARTFKVVRLSVSACHEPEGWGGRARDALGLLISGVLIMARADQLRLDPRTPDAARQLDAARIVAPPAGAAPVGERRTVWSPVAWEAWGLDAAAGCASVDLTVTPSIWWTSELGASGRKTLAYLEKRVDLEERMKPRLQRRRRGFLNRLSGLIRWR